MVDGGSGGSSPEDLYRRLPPVSKVLLTAMVATAVTTLLGICSPRSYALSFPLVWEKFHLWRVLTAGVFMGADPFNIYLAGVFSIR